MMYSKSFPRTVEGPNYPRWEEIKLSDEEEKAVEVLCKEDNTALLKECIDDARKIFQEKGLKDYQTDLVNVALALFEKRASHSVHWKENKAKEKFDKMFG